MDLSPEQKARIFEEEQRRVAEEHYRESVRRTLSAGKAPGPSSGKILAFLILLVILTVAIVAAVKSDQITPPERSSLQPPTFFWKPVRKEINETLQVAPLNYRFYKLEVDGERMRNYRIAGHFNAGGGLGNDIMVVLATDDEFANWINGHAASAYFNSGPKTTGSFDVRLPAGSYILAFSNKTAIISPKQVSVVATIMYEEKP